MREKKGNQSTELNTEDSPSIDPSNTTPHVKNEPVKDYDNNIEPSVSNGTPDPVKGLGQTECSSYCRTR